MYHCWSGSGQDGRTSSKSRLTRASANAGGQVDIKTLLANELAAGRLVVVAGTGVTTALTGGEPTSSWLGLIKDGVKHVEKRDPAKAAILDLRLDEASGADDLIGIAQDLKRYLGEDFGRWIGQSIGQLPLKNPELAEAMGKLGAPILTTNYDDLIERALGLPSASWHQPSDMRRALLKQRPGVGHLHGVWNVLESIVFSQSDYQHITESPDAQALQTGAFVMKTFLFIGVGDGLDDPNFSPMVKAFGERFPTSPHPHFRLCRDSEVDPATELKTVIDVGFGARHEDLPGFLLSLAPSPTAVTKLDLGAKSQNHLLDVLRENSALWRDAETLSEKTLSELVVPPIFLPEPHDQYATSAVLKSEKDKPSPIDLTESLIEGGFILIAGEESSGVSTAVSFALTKALEVRPSSHSILVDDPMAAGLRPVARVVERTYRRWEVDPIPEDVSKQLVLGVDNLRFDGSARFQRALDDLVASDASLTVIGVRQNDAAEISNALRDRTGQDVKVVFLGRFSDSEALELARRVAPGRETKVANYVMVVIREKNLPRTPFTITLLVDLVQSGVLLQKQESEVAVLDQYLDLLLNADFIRSPEELDMTVRNKRFVLELLARRFVEHREDKASEPEIAEWLRKEFDELGWSYNVAQCINDLVARRVLARSANDTLRFQRSAYLELMAGIAARDDQEFRSLVFKSPIQLASIVRTYAAMSRKASDVLEIVEREIERIAIAPPSGAIFASVRKIDAKNDLFADASETDDAGAEPHEGHDGSVERDGLTGDYYDDSDDSDTPAFLTARIEDLSEARVAMLVVDLASRVLRDSDEVRDQKLKSRILAKLLVAWAAFTDLYEVELAALPDLDDIIATIMSESDQDSNDPDEAERMKHFVVRLYPSLVTSGGIRYCLSGPTLVSRLIDVKPEGENANLAFMMRTMALYGTQGNRWIETLRDIDDDAVKTFFGASFLATLARFAYVSDPSLTEQEAGEIRAFLRRVISARYNFDGVDHRVRVLNDFENKLRRERLDEGRKLSPKSIGV